MNIKEIHAYERWLRSILSNIQSLLWTAGFVGFAVGMIIGFLFGILSR